MKSGRLIVGVFALLLVGAPSYAQEKETPEAQAMAAAPPPGGSLIPLQQITWVQAGVEPPQAQSFVYTLTIMLEGNPTPVAVGLLSVLCGGPVTAAECSTALPAAGQPAIITGNTSTLKALDGRNNQTSPASAPFTGNQGCIFRDRIYKVGERGQIQTTKQGLNVTLREFQAAKFKHISTQDLKGNAFLITEECAGKLIP